MKKRLLVGILALIAATCSAAFITACGKVSEMTTLSEPVITGYEPEVGKISWQFVENADSYEITLSDGKGEPTTTTVKVNSVTYKTEAEQFEFSITAKGGSIFSDSNTVSKTFVKLDSKLELTVNNDGSVSWEAVDGATGYDVAVDNNTVATSIADNSYSEVKAGSAHKVKVKPVRSSTETTFYYSTWSEAVSVNILKSVDNKNITYKDGYIQWPSVASATSYVVTVNNNKYEDITENKLAYGADGESFSATVQAIGNHTTTFDGAVSEAKSFVYLPTVTGVTVDNGALTWEAVEGATGYQVKLNGETSAPQTVNTNSYPKLSAGTNYSVSIMPTATATDTTYFSDWSAPVNISILPAPVLQWTGVEVDGTDKVNAINWNIVDGAGGYVARVTTPDGNKTEETLGANNNFYGNNFATTGTYTVEVKATSDSADTFESAYSKPMTVTRLAAPTVTNERITSTAGDLSKGFTVTFAPVSGASNYAIYKDGTQIQTSTKPQFIVNDIVEVDNTREIQVAYYVRSLGKVSGNNIVLDSVPASTSNTTNSAFTVTVLATPTEPTIEGTVYKFTGTSGNSGYNVNIGGNDNNAANTSLDLDGLIKAAGNYDVKVCSKGNGHEVLASTFAPSIQVVRLNAPTNVRISTDESDGVLNFDGDNRASSYTAVITGQPEPLTVDTTTNIKPYIKTTATIVTMYSENNDFYDAQHTVYYMRSLASTNFTFYKLETPGNVNFDNDYMTWNKPTNLSSSSTFTPNYKIFNLNNDTVYNGDFSGTSYSLTNLKGGESYSFGIVAIGDGTNSINSDVAESRQIYKLEKPTLSVNTTDFRYEWDAISSASNYILSIDGKAVSTDNIHESGNTYTYIPNYEAIGNHAVILYAQGDGGNTTVNSDRFEYTQNVAQLTTPEFKYSYSADCYEPDGKITVNVTKETNCPNGYYYVMGGTAQYSKEISYDFTPNTSGAITISMYAKGGSFDSNETYYLDSRPAKEVTLNLLGYPTESTITVNQDGVITWGSITGASGYIYKLTIVGTDGKNYVYEGTINSKTEKLDLSKPFTAKDEGGNDVTLKYTQVRTMTLELQAKGTLSANTETANNGSVTSAKATRVWSSNIH